MRITVFPHLTPLPGTRKVGQHHFAGPGISRSNIARMPGVRRTRLNRKSGYAFMPLL